MKQLILILFSLSGLIMSGQESIEIPRDTSFTRHSTAVKIRRQHPYARLTSETLPQGVEMIPDVEYARLNDTPFGDRRLHIDIFRPSDAETPLPAVIFIHGGGWNSGDKSLQHGLAAAVASHGYVTMAVEYRLTPEAPYPAGLHDIKSAIRWARSHAADYGIDPDHIALSGCSAGGQLAALAGTTNGSRVHEGEGPWQGVSSRVSAVVNIDGITTFVSDYNIADVYDRLKKKASRPVNSLWLGGLPDETPENWREASALLWVTDQSAPICFINSDLPRYRDGRDSIVPLLHAHGIPTEQHLVHSPIHPFWFFHPWFIPTVTHATSFLDRILKGKDD